MDYFFGIGNIIIGIIALLVSFEVISIFREEEEKQEWLLKFGNIFKIIGVILIVGGLFKLF